ncbi:MAG: hypothetical protein PHF86_05810 [Candidatus Nanoarchaeia archaeon]|nr:hypothetical protein [Candidatus Nanoarchaeia archaeon]
MNKIKIKKIFEIILVISFIFFIQSVNAASYGCCEKIGNQYCQPGSQEQCDQSNGLLFIPSVSCANTDVCKLGTCIVDGQCFGNYPKSKCNHLNGQWYDKSMDKIADCIPGCCVVGTNCKLTTSANCDKITPEGFTANFLSDIRNEQACVAECSNQDKGCCVYGENIYSYGTREQCNNLNGDFKLNSICSSVSGSKCISHSKKGCIEGSNNLYWFDSCGNPEDVAQTCNYPNEICASDINDQNNNNNKDEFVCRSLNCVNTYDNPLLEGDGGTRLNGESWCEYQSASGPGMDLPGSVHYRHYCIDGVEYAVNCGNNRDEMCIYGKFTENSLLQGLPDMSYSQCVENRASDCAKQKTKVKCENTQERDCLWTGGNKTKDGDCIPIVSLGFTKDQKEEAQKICSKADKNIDVLWTSEKKCSGTSCYDEWSCKDNCNVFNKDILKATNFLCMAQGDCGASLSVADTYSKSGFNRICGSGQPNGAHVNKEPCINVIKESLWDKFYTSDFNTNKLGLNFGSVNADNSILPYLINANIIYSISNPSIFINNNLLSMYTTYLKSIFIDPIGAIFKLSLDILGFGTINNQKVETLKINCNPWQVPAGGDDCYKCSTAVSKGGLLPDKNGDIINGYACQEYTCGTLGTACKYIKNTVDGSVCVKAECNNVLPPIIKSDTDLLKTGNSNCCSESSDQLACSVTDCLLIDNGANIGYDITRNVNEMKTFSFGIKTFDEKGIPLYTQCAYSDQPTKQINDNGELINGMDTMSYLSNGQASTQHNITFTAGYLASLNEQEQKFYLRCKTAVEDSCSQAVESPIDYVIRFKVHQGPDTTVPLIESIEPDPGFVAYDQDTKDVTLTTNEILTWNSILQKAGGCKWSDQNIGYDQMLNENSGLCLVPGMYESQKCSFKIGNLKSGSNTIYFACSDPAGNKMSMGKPYTLTRTNQLNVSLSVVSPDCVIGNEINCYTNNVTLKAETNGGAESGKSVCYFSETCEECSDVSFYSTNSSTHTQILEFFNTQPYTFYVNCLDLAENIAKSSIKFNTMIDNTAPKLIGVNHDTQYDKLRITVEDANTVKCFYSNKEFSLNEGTEMSSIGNSFYAEWGLGLYYIRCEDKFGNEMPLSVVHTSAIV